MAESEGSSAVTVHICGEDHVIRTNVEPEYTRRCAKWVDDRISEIRKHAGRIESHKAAILAALSITDELFQARSQMEEVQGDTVDRVEELAKRLEMVLVEESQELELPLDGGSPDQE
jgi:cell division protein ZapA